MPKNYKNKMSHSTAVRKLEAFIERVQYWNENYSKYYRVVDVVLLGSLARNETKVSDIDLCVKIERTMGFQVNEHKSDYLVWRKDVLGYAAPDDYFKQVNMFETDVTRYLKARDGRYDVLRWGELVGLSLTLDPIVTLVSEGALQYESIEVALENASSISHDRAISIVEAGALSRKEVYWDSYCNALSKFPPFVREAILKRDNCQSEYLSYIEDKK
ncbi:nucleotidyltransferase domain-containing protein [Photobacterium ganghwense]|uniref:nucleotidyltransferase domain-containing protein n=1 Tax=Photobacterium ganghwense TaxID=320778 RepID=UPI0039F0E3D3